MGKYSLVQQYCLYSHSNDQSVLPVLDQVVFTPCKCGAPSKKEVVRNLIYDGRHRLQYHPSKECSSLGQYRIAGYFRGVLIFAIFVVRL